MNKEDIELYRNKSVRIGLKNGYTNYGLLAKITNSALVLRSDKYGLTTIDLSCISSICLKNAEGGE